MALEKDYLVQDGGAERVSWSSAGFVSAGADIRARFMTLSAAMLAFGNAVRIRVHPFGIDTHLAHRAISMVPPVHANGCGASGSACGFDLVISSSSRSQKGADRVAGKVLHVCYCAIRPRVSCGRIESDGFE